ncbi:GTP-binding protein [Hoeflea sp. YIM 152468]|uniref:CobW family GTP-binding protein n=1 Tax=Hoeflea sp. YIM 152468 TaxID=3031759 RepID=UPI0023DA97A1|nr:GTP-binding protein [Hoeflea sp. YIM 152468]MDF1608081.1 GTP-binding protein [Hoeflea sp. YIM 152468]
MTDNSSPARVWSAPRGVPVSILTGFLGAGKTTLLNRLIGDPWLSDAALIINEFGDIGIDHLLVESSSDGVIELSDGCLCCTVRGELVDTLADLMDRMQSGRIRPFSRVVIETTGLADPVPVMQSVIGHPALGQSYRLEGLVTVVDAVHGLAALGDHEEARRQVAVADTLVLSKTALVDDCDDLRLRLEALNPLARVVKADAPDITAQGLFDTGAYDPVARSLDVARWLNSAHDTHAHDHAHHHQGKGRAHRHDVNRHDAHIRADSIVLDTPISPEALAMFIDLLRSAHGPNLLRMKGIIRLTDDPSRPLVLHAVQSLMSEPVRLSAWPEGARQETRLVVISRDMPEGFITELFSAFANEPGIGRPDRDALTDNPLAIPGMPSRR